MSNDDEVPAPPPALVTRVGKPAPKVPKGTIPRSVATMYFALEHIKEIHLYLDEPSDTAKKEVAGEAWSVEYVTSLKRRVRGRVRRNWFPAGKWEVATEPWLKFENGRWTIIISDRVATSLGYISYKRLSPEGIDQTLTDTLREREKHTSLLSLDFDGEDGMTIRRLIEGTYGVPVALEVSYAKAGGGSTGSLEEISPLTDEHVDVLANEAVARLFLQFLEHFGDIPVDYQTAQGGLSREELEQLMDGHPGRGNEIERFVNLFTQGYAEFEAARGEAQQPAGLAEFKAMEEAIFYQRKAGNDLALRNQLKIAVGDHFYTTTEGKGAFNRDIGVLRRDSASGVLLYDREGIAMRSLLGYWDSDYTSVSLGKVERDSSIPLRSRELSDHNIKVLFQAFGLPALEIHALTASLYRHFAFITVEVHKRYNGEIGERIIAMMPWVVGFFVGHAMAGFLMTTGWGLAPGFLLLGALKAAGWVMGFDFAFMVTQEATAAGREFVQMERLHRESGDKEPRLTALSQSHLEAGAKALIDAMADVVSLGVVVVGGKVAGKVGPAVKKGLSKPPAEARLELTVDANDTVTAVEPMKVKDQVGTGWLEELLQKGTEGDGAAAEPPEAEGDARQLGQTPETPASLGESNVAPASSPEASAGEGVGSAATEVFEKKAAESWKDRSIEEDGPYVGKGMKGRVPRGRFGRLWEKFVPANNEAFQQRLQVFRGNSDLNATHSGGEGRIFCADGKLTALKRWFEARIGDMPRSLELLEKVRLEVEADAQLRGLLDVVNIHERGPDWILRDYDPISRELKSANESANAKAARGQAIARLEGRERVEDLCDVLKDLLKKLKKEPPSANLHWSDSRKKIIVIDMM